LFITLPYFHSIKLATLQTEKTIFLFFAQESRAGYIHFSIRHLHLSQTPGNFESARKGCEENILDNRSKVVRSLTAGTTGGRSSAA
jgi:hypothetical protein